MFASIAFLLLVQPNVERIELDRYPGAIRFSPQDRYVVLEGGLLYDRAAKKLVRTPGFRGDVSFSEQHFVSVDANEAVFLVELPSGKHQRLDLTAIAASFVPGKEQFVFFRKGPTTLELGVYDVRSRKVLYSSRIGGDAYVYLKGWPDSKTITFRLEADGKNVDASFDLGTRKLITRKVDHAPVHYFSGGGKLRNDVQGDGLMLGEEIRVVYESAGSKPVALFTQKSSGGAISAGHELGPEISGARDAPLGLVFGVTRDEKLARIWLLDPLKARYRLLLSGPYVMPPEHDGTSMSAALSSDGKLVAYVGLNEPYVVYIRPVEGLGQARWLTKK